PALERLAVDGDDHVEPVEPRLVGRRADQDVPGDDLATDQREQGPEARDPLALGVAPTGFEVERVPRVVERAVETLEHAVAEVAGAPAAADAAAAVERQRRHRLGPGVGADAQAVEPAQRPREAAAHSAAAHLDLAPLLPGEHPARAYQRAVDDEVEAV